MIKINKKMQNIKMASMIIVSLTLLPLALNAQSLEEKIAQAEQNLQKLSQQQSETQKMLNELENTHQEGLEESRKTNPLNRYDIKVKEIKANKEKQKAEIKEQAEIKQEIQKEKEEKSEIIKKERKPTYVPRKNNTQGRRPFRKSSSLDGSETYALVKGSEVFSYASEAESSSSQVYSGTTEENVFVFSDNLANYCKVDTKSIDKMPECLNKVITEKASGVQTAKAKMQTLYEESLQDMTVNDVMEAAKAKNDSSGFEKNVLLPLQDKSSKSTDERGDIEVLTFSEMEGLKLKNKIIQIYSNLLAREAFVDFGNYEVSEMGITNIEEQYKQETETQGD